MKTKILALALITSVVYATDASMAWVDKKIEEIKPQRNGLDNNTLSKLTSPFVVLATANTNTGSGSGSGGTVIKANAKDSNSTTEPAEEDLSKAPFILQMVLNSSALINGKWLKENDLTRGYTLTQIQSGYVVLEKKNKQVKLFIAQKNKNLDISTK